MIYNCSFFTDEYCKCFFFGVILKDSRKEGNVKKVLAEKF